MYTMLVESCGSMLIIWLKQSCLYAMAHVCDCVCVCVRAHRLFYEAACILLAHIPDCTILYLLTCNTCTRLMMCACAQHRLFEESRYEAARVLFAHIPNWGRLASTLVKLERYQQAVDAARKANSPKVCVQSRCGDVPARRGLHVGGRCVFMCACHPGQAGWSGTSRQSRCCPPSRQGAQSRCGDVAMSWQEGGCCVFHLATQLSVRTCKEFRHQHACAAPCFSHI